MSSFWQGLTWFGDSGFLLPTALWLFVWLASDRATRWVAVCWAGLFGACGLIVMASKLAFMGWGIGSAEYDFTGFSGHTALAACVWPVTCWLLNFAPAAGGRLAAAGCGWICAALIGYSRLALGVHSDAEVLTGLLLGTSMCVIFLWSQREWHEAHRRSRRWLGVGLIVLCGMLTFGKPAPTQEVLAGMATWIAGIKRPFTRLDLLTIHALPRGSCNHDGLQVCI